MTATKLVLCTGALLVLVCSSFAAKCTTTVEGSKDYGDPLDFSPKFYLTEDTYGGSVEKPAVINLIGCLDELDNEYYIKIDVSIPIFNVSAVPPTGGAPFPETEDDFEHFRVYFANNDNRILEIKYSRFGKQRTRLLSRPYNVLRTELDVLHSDVPLENDGNWIVGVYFRTELLPANMTKASVVVINPMAEPAGYRYQTNYRIYNHPLSLLDVQVTSKFTTVKPGDLVPEANNTEYSAWWQGLVE